MFAAAIAYCAVRAQIREARKEYLEQREAAQRAQKQEEAVAARLVDAALEAFKFDLNRVRNTFDPGSDPQFDNQMIEPERARWLRQRLRPLVTNDMLLYVGRLKPEPAREFFLIAAISERTRDADHPVTYSELRDDLRNMSKRTVDLQQALKTESKQYAEQADRTNRKPGGRAR